MATLSNHRFLSEPDYINNLTDAVHIPQSNVERAISSLNKANILNLFGHYAHDEHQSPYASYLYNRSAEELNEEQTEYVAKMRAVREKWGSWNFVDQSQIGDPNLVRPIIDLGTKFEYKDYTYEALAKEDNYNGENAWQTDKTYVDDLLHEAKNLLDRVTEGIYAEYGYPTIKPDGTSLSPEEIITRNKMFEVNIIPDDDTTPDINGAAWMTNRSSTFLSRKLLHAMLTNDDFFVVMGGHSAAAGHGNNFLQEYMMSFHYLMEPVFQKLGVRLVSRNLAMGGLGTLHFDLGAGTLYGESDFMIWDSGMTEKEPGNRDLFNKQALLSGERVPLIFTTSIFDLEQETNHTIAHGDFGKMESIIPLTEDFEQAKTLPFASRFMKCGSDCDACNHGEKYHSSCWIPRSDVVPKKKQNNAVGGGASWHPGNRHHHHHGRKIALTMLHGLKAAIETWEKGMKKDGFPLKTEYWHVGESYKALQTNLENTFKNGDHQNECEKHFTQYPRACRVPMFGMGEYSPKALDDQSSIRNFIVQDGMTKSDKQKLLDSPPNLYSGVDIFPLNWKIPDEEVDVHAIAIVTNYLEASLNDEWKADTGKDEGTSRKLLRDKLLEEKKGTRSEGGVVVPQRSLSNEVVVDNNAGKSRHTQATVETISPGKGWILGGYPSAGFCDGSSNSECQRQDGDSCLAANTNDSRGVISGDNMSGWLVIQIPRLENGLILARMEWWHPMHTTDWTEVNNGGNEDERRQLLEGQMNNFNDFTIDDRTGEHRQTKAAPPPLVDDFEFDIALDGRIVKTWNATEYKRLAAEISYNEAIFPIYDDENTVEPDGVQLAFRVRSASTDPKAHRAISITHIYYS